MTYVYDTVHMASSVHMTLSQREASSIYTMVQGADWPCMYCNRHLLAQESGKHALKLPEGWALCFSTKDSWEPHCPQ